MSNRRWVGGEFVGVDPRADQVQRQVADHLRRRRDLDQPAQHPVGRGVAVFDLLEPVPQPQRDRLLAQVGQLAARDLVVIDPPGRRRAARIRRARTPFAAPPSTAPARRPPAGDSPVSYSVCAAAATIALQRGWLVVPAIGARRAVDRVGPRLPRGQIGGQLAARGVVGVHVHRQVEAGRAAR